MSQKGNVKGRGDTLNVAYGDSLNALNELFLICLLWLKTSHMQAYYHMLNGRMLLLEQEIARERGSVKELYASVEECVQILISTQGGV